MATTSEAELRLDALLADGDEKIDSTGDAAGADSSGEEISIESYFDDLMRRVNGGAGGKSASDRAARPTIPAPAPPPAKPKPQQPPAKPPVATAERKEFAPTSRAPENAEQIARMRDVARSSAEDALSRTRTTVGKQARRDLSLAGVSVLAAPLLFCYSGGAVSVPYWLAIGTLVLGTWFTGRFFRGVERM